MLSRIRESRGPCADAVRPRLRSSPPTTPPAPLKLVQTGKMSCEVNGKKVGALGFGLMGFTWRPDPPPVDQALEALQAAFESGMTLWNGAEFYGTPQYNTMTLLEKYFTHRPGDADKICLIMKGGMDLTSQKPDGSPEGVRRSIDNILKQLNGKKKVDLFSYARRDPNTPLKTTFDTIQKEYVETGKIGGISLSECSAETIHEAAKLGFKIEAVEVELSMFSPDILGNGVVAACSEHGIPITAYSPIGRGMLTGKFKDTQSVEHLGFLSKFPRFEAEAMKHNLKLVEQVETLAKEKGCSPAQLAISWVQHQGGRPGRPTVVPIPGATTVARVKENSKLIPLSKDELAKLDKIVDEFETKGDRYPSSVPTNT
ncbi:hypothetical protein XA68_16002 [Ophiocordyceps unilateralis]|uniref:NADP-dependent oxidoreductase domain-containing protein n=1 Tax=Ophiocordyceps unilateralis TaxID=268505 RepID=A0A2A9PKX3_OPHUN|nr:hypothetical protein XA68_16002 [Ophiocordyceps unilateralis]